MLSGEDRFDIAGKARKRYNQQQKQARKAKNDANQSPKESKVVVSEIKETQNSIAKPCSDPTLTPRSNLDRFWSLLRLQFQPSISLRLLVHWIVRVFIADKVFGPNSITDTVYEEGVKNVALSSLMGINATIFAYGQTSSGKTYTMRGITEKAVIDIYNHIMNTIESTLRENSDCVRSFVASLNFVDLAGSERASQTHTDGARLREGCHINLSLMTLTTVIRKLSVGKRSGHIPYRDSKLTFAYCSILLGGMHALLSYMEMEIEELKRQRDIAQSQLGDEANRALEVLQKEVACHRLGNQDAAETIANLQAEIREMQSVRSVPKDVDVGTVVATNKSVSANLKEEITRLHSQGTTIANLEEQLESVQKSIDKLVMSLPSNF
ncbi:hypothetical protein J5N97_002043 [Dioscorea zingiberensis]|uniref:Kinesin-like protein n=1 Tax=Dioscorea zingiberensis TaxID=325984 RepID=A0A9D5BT76_9LILI|nr:hypothetical protein J5N97_002043 [Dioscorea zingiberensis]